MSERWLRSVSACGASFAGLPVRGGGGAWTGGTGLASREVSGFDANLLLMKGNPRTRLRIVITTPGRAVSLPCARVKPSSSRTSTMAVTVLPFTIRFLIARFLEFELESGGGGELQG